ncbi:hypothetical protein PoMZ_06376, partial [Pyricularia oryzae]
MGKWPSQHRTISLQLHAERSNFSQRKIAQTAAVQDSAAIHSSLGSTAYCACLRPASNSLVANPRLSVYYGSHDHGYANLLNMRCNMSAQPEVEADYHSTTGIIQNVGLCYRWALSCFSSLDTNVDQ